MRRRPRSLRRQDSLYGRPASSHAVLPTFRMGAEKARFNDAPVEYRAAKRNEDSRISTVAESQKGFVAHGDVAQRKRGSPWLSIWRRLSVVERPTRRKYERVGRA